MKRVPIAVALSFLLMVIVNALANILPIAGLQTGEVSNAYPNLFAPAAITFSIWGVIYLLLALHSFYQFIGKDADKLQNIGLLFTISSLANTIWIFCWHYRQIALSLLCMIAILILLIRINQRIQDMKGDKLFIWAVRIPFAVYFGWITVATIANVTTLLVSVSWSGWGIGESRWTILVLIVGMVIGLLWAFKAKDKAYLITLIWAYTGILIKHTSQKGFGSAYPPIIIVVALALVAFALSLILFFKQTKQV